MFESLSTEKLVQESHEIKKKTTIKAIIFPKKPSYGRIFFQGAILDDKMSIFSESSLMASTMTPR